MAFKLEVELSGLCNYLIVKNKNEVGVVMPDARQNGCMVKPFDWDACKKHLVPHVGYLRYNLADRGINVPPMALNGTPEYEVVHRFNFEQLDFAFGDTDDDEECNDDSETAAADGDTKFIYAADVHGFDPCAKPRPGLFGAEPPKELLMRTVLRGGTFEKQDRAGLWYFDTTLQTSKSDDPYQTLLSGTAKWTRTVRRKHVVLRLSSWRHSYVTSIRLRPATGDTVRIKIANLCSNNPLEWPELHPRIFDSTADEDFKWLYLLWEDNRGCFGDLCGGYPPKPLPVPHPHPVHGDVWNCGNAKMNVDSL